MVASQIWSIFVCSTGIHHLTHFNGIKKVLVYKTKKNNFLKCKCACFQNLFLIYQFLIYPMIGKFVTVWYFNTYINHLTLSVQSLTNMSSMWNSLTLHLLTFWHLTFWHENGFAGSGRVSRLDWGIWEDVYRLSPSLFLLFFASFTISPPAHIFCSSALTGSLIEATPIPGPSKIDH